MNLKVKEEIERLKAETIRIRRDLHRHPELGFEEYRTSDIIFDYLQNCGIDVKRMAKTGVAGLLKGSKPGPTILLRADMDALPITEENQVPYKSLIEGKMHACGHDGHVAMLLTAAKILAVHKDQLQGNIKFVFQPNEEDAGAYLMIEEGVLEDPKVEAAFGLHLWSPLRSGQIGVTGGCIMAGQYNFSLTVTGKGGHSGAPHTAVDPVLAAANIIQAVQGITTREIDPLRSTAILFGKIQGGTAPNIIPEKVDLEGSIRFLYEDGAQLKERFERIVGGICQAQRCTYALRFTLSSSPLINDPALAGFVQRIAASSVGTENVVPYITMGGEDFAEYALKVPGVFSFIGTGDKEKGTDYPHHHPHFNLDEDTLSIGVEMQIKTALAYLNGLDWLTSRL